MQNKGAVIFLTVIVTLLCIYYLSFTFVAREVQQDAVEFATDESGVVDLGKKQVYLDSVYNLPVYNLFGIEYTYKEVKESELSLGLDLRGGMHVTLEISPDEILKGLSGDSEDPAFLAALQKANQRQRNSQDEYADLFYQAYEETTDKPLAEIFATAANRGRISRSDSDEAVMEIISKEINDAIERSFIILRTRIDQFGTSQPNIQRLQNSGRIQIEIPGADNPDRIRKLLQGVAKLEFWEVAELNEINNSLMAINDLLVKEQQASLKAGTASSNEEDEQVDQNEEDLGDFLSSEEPDTTDNELDEALSSDTATEDSSLDSLEAQVSPLFSLTRAPGGLIYDVSDTAVIGEIMRRDDVQSILPRSVKPLWDVKPTINEETGEKLLQLHFVRTGRGGNAKLTGEVITDARQELDQYSRPAVSMQMNALGTRVWAKMTAQAANESPRGRIAIVLDDRVYSAPSVNGEIPNGNSQISGNFTIEEAKDLANILKAGSLPAPTRIVEEAIVGPTLGQVAQRQGFISIIAGLIAVVLFMVAYYAKGGLVANVALVFNIFFILGILAQFNASLTLPGIAGIILTIGMCVDANVLIFERIKEELRNGVKLRAAITEGYQRAFSSIVDGNVTTLLVAIILYVLGQGAVKGFAITLMIGIFCSFFTAVYITRVIVERMVRRSGDESKISFETPLSGKRFSSLGIDFIRRRRFAYIVSTIIIVTGMAITFTQGLNLGVDFKGGRSYIVNFAEPVEATDMKLALDKSFKNASTEVKNFGGNNTVKITTSYLVDDESAAADEAVKSAVINGIESFTGQQYVSNNSSVDDDHFTITGSSKVGATVADDIMMSSYEAGFFAIIAVFLYILIRFRKWQYSAGALIALVHDSLMIFSAFAIAGLFGVKFEIDQVFIAALLTVIGYSINDTVVVFDRIREYMNLGTSSDKIKVFNAAMNTTLNRTLMTSFTTLLVVLILFIFGGEVLRGFSFALLIGILTGTYSSVFVASPAVIDLDKNKEVPKPVPA